MRTMTTTVARFRSMMEGQVPLLQERLQKAKAHEKHSLLQQLNEALRLPKLPDEIVGEIARSLGWRVTGS